MNYYYLNNVLRLVSMDTSSTLEQSTIHSLLTADNIDTSLILQHNTKVNLYTVKDIEKQSIELENKDLIIKMMGMQRDIDRRNEK